MSGDPPLSTVGSGDPGPGCGDHRVMVCHDCQGYFATASQCYLKTCPNCYGAWASRRGRDAAQRAWSYSLTVSRTDIKYDHFGGVETPATTPFRHPHLYHVVISFRPTEGALTIDDVRALRRRAYDVAKRHYLVGGVAVFHAGREQDRYLTDGPHVHMVALAVNIAPGGVHQEEASGDVVFKVIPFRGNDGQVDTWFLRKQREARNVLSYLLTHTVTGSGLHSLTYFGAMAYNRYPQDRVLDHIKRGWVEGSESEPWERCPFCGSDKVSQYRGEDWTDPCRPMSYFCGPGPPSDAELPLITRELVAEWSSPDVILRKSVETY